MSYTDLLQSYQDRLSSMAQNEESVGDYLLNKSQEKINSYLEKTGIPSQIGGVLEQVGILSNNSAVQTLLSKSGLKGVFDQQVEALNRNINGLKDQMKEVQDKAVDFVDKQVESAENISQPILTRSQEGINMARQAEAQVRELPQQAQQILGEARAAGEQVLGEARAAGEQVIQQAQTTIGEARQEVQGSIENLTRGTQEVAQSAMSGVTERFSPEYLQSLSDDELKQAASQAFSRKQALRQQYEESELPNREQTFQKLTTEGRAERQAYLNEAERRGLYQREQPTAQLQQPETQGVIEEPNVRPSQVARGAPEFETPSQQLPQIPREVPSEIEPAIEPVAQEEQTVSNVATKTETAISDVGKVGTGLEETTAELPGISDVGEVVGALLQIGSLIASAFKPHEDVQSITTPITGFGFGSMNQYGVGGSSIV